MKRELQVTLGITAAGIDDEALAIKVSEALAQLCDQEWFWQGAYASCRGWTASNGVDVVLTYTDTMDGKSA